MARHLRGWGQIGALMVLASFGCKVRTPTYCEKTEDCGAGLICDTLAKECVATDAATLPDSGGGAGGSDLTGSGGGGAGGGADAETPDGADASAERPECLASTDCQDSAKPICSPAGTCVSCVAAGTGACAQKNAARAVCTATGACVECGASSDCRESTKPICSMAGACTSCGVASPGACAQKDASRTVCGATGACVECGVSSDCHDAVKPICSAGACVACGAATTGACAQKDASRAVCSGTGACVECGANTDCHTTTKPFCSTAGACVGCGQAPAGVGACATRSSAQPVCAPSGACVQCVANADCASTTPVCSGTNTCGPCTTDGDCTGRAGPIVCMSHQDGRCATEAETIYVKAGGACSDASGNSGGTSAMPYCSMQPAVGTVGATRDLIVVRGTVAASSSPISAGAKQVTIVGQTSPVVAGGVNTVVHLAAGDVFIRDLKLTATTAIGCQADAGSTLRLLRVNVTGNSGGGIFLDGAAFDIRNTTVTNNGPSADLTWGGIRIQNRPSSGPAQLQLLTVQSNNPSGISCMGPVPGTGVLASGNVSGDISSTCGFSSCGAASPTCGSQQ